MKQQSKYLILFVVTVLGVMLVVINQKKTKESALLVNVSIEDVKQIAITFDDGPHPVYTKQLLGGLKKAWCQSHVFCDWRECREISRNCGADE